MLDDAYIKEMNPGLLIWIVLSIPIGGALFFLTCADLLSASFYLFFTLMNVGFLVSAFVPWFSDLTEDSNDWETDEDNPEQIGLWSVMGLVGLLIVSVIIGVCFMGKVIEPSLWVPQELFQLTTDASSLGFMITLTGTWFAVVPGEEGFKNLLSYFHKSYEPQGWNLPFAFHPARLIANSAWAILHVIKGQYVWVFFFSVLISGVIMDVVSARCGTILSNYFVHAMFNTAVLIGTLIFGGYLTLVW